MSLDESSNEQTFLTNQIIKPKGTNTDKVQTRVVSAANPYSNINIKIEGDTTSHMPDQVERESSREKDSTGSLKSIRFEPMK